MQSKRRVVFQQWNECRVAIGIGTQSEQGGFIILAYCILRREVCSHNMNHYTPHLENVYINSLKIYYLH